jgi:predicted NBD/HSP70 family sugar kinase
MYSLGINVGATRTHGVALDDANQVVAQAAVFTRRGPKGVKKVLMEVARGVSEKSGVGLRDFDAVGVGIPGMVDFKKGEVTSAVNLRVDHMALRSLIAPHFSVSVRMDNDVKATVIGAGMLLGTLSVTYVNFGTGVAAATLADRVIRGRNNEAGEIGHLRFEEDGEPCRCGQTGCIETIVGGAYLAPRMDRLQLDWPTLDQCQSELGRAEAARCVRVIARIVTMMAVAYAAEYIVLGGGVIRAAPWVVPAVRRHLVEQGLGATFPPFERIAAQTVTLAQDLQLPAIGAALVGQGWTEGYKL